MRIERSAFYGLAQSSSGQQTSRVQHRQRRLLLRHQQWNLGAAEDYGVAAFVLQRADYFREIDLRARQKHALDQLVEDDAMNALTLFRAGDAILDARGFQFLTVDRTLHQRAGSQNSQTLVAVALRLVRNLDRDVQPGARRAVLHQVEGLMNRVDGSNQKIGSGPGQLISRGEHEFSNTHPVVGVDALHVIGEAVAVH